MASNVLYFGLGYPYGPAWLSLIVAIWTAVTGGQAGRLGHRLCRTGRLLQPGRPARPGRARHPLSIAAHLGWLLLVLVAAEVATAGRQRRQAAARGRGRGGQAAGRRGAHAHRPRAPRRPRPQHLLINVQAGVALHLMDEQPGQSAPPWSPSSRLQRRPGRAAVGAGRAPPGRRGGGRGRPPPAWPSWTAWSRGRSRPAWRCAPGSRAPRPAGRDRPGRLPDRAGVADQRDPPRRPGGQRHRPDRLWRGRVGGGGHGRRPRVAAGRGWSRPPVDDRQTPTGRFAGRADQAGAWSACAAGGRLGGESRRRTPARRRVPGRGPPPLDHEGVPRDPGAAGRRPGAGPGGIRALLDAQEGIEVVGEAADGEEALRLARHCGPTWC